MTRRRVERTSARRKVTARSKAFERVSFCHAVPINDCGQFLRPSATLGLLAHQVRHFFCACEFPWDKTLCMGHRTTMTHIMFILYASLRGPCSWFTFFAVVNEHGVFDHGLSPFHSHHVRPFFVFLFVFASSCLSPSHRRGVEVCSSQFPLQNVHKKRNSPQRARSVTYTGNTTRHFRYGATHAKKQIRAKLDERQ